MEIAIVVFLGLWLSGAALLAYLQFRKDYSEELELIAKEDDVK